jgi:hypothetical protein
MAVDTILPHWGGSCEYANALSDPMKQGFFLHWASQGLRSTNLASQRNPTDGAMSVDWCDIFRIPYKDDTTGDFPNV